MITRILIPLVLLSALVVGLAACSDDDGNGGANGEEPTATAVPDGEEPEPTEMADEGNGDGVTDEGSDDRGGDDDGDESSDSGDSSASVTVDGDTTELEVDECIPPEGDNPIVVLATNDDEDAELTLGGIAGAVTVGFERDGENWFVVGAFLEVNGSTFSYSGPALKDGADPPDTEIAFEVTC